MTAPRDETLTIYYDGACPLCRAEIAHYGAIDEARKLRFVDASASETDLGPDLPRAAALGRFHVRKADGTLVSGAAGFVAIWSVLPRWRWAGRLARLPGVTPLLEVLYRGFLPLRPYISRLFARLTGRQHTSCQ